MKLARENAKLALRKQFNGTTDSQGYVDWPQGNLIPGVRLDQFEADLRRGDGNELRMKFCAVHSSAALAINCFAPFKDRPENVEILGQRGAVGIEFEKRLKIFPERRPSNLDVWINLGGGAIAIESKMLEYFQPKVAEFAPAYGNLAPPKSEPCWWAVFEEAQEDLAQYLDRAQLVKHYFGLRRLQDLPVAPAELTLLYLFWEPLNWSDVAECRQHRQEVAAFADKVATSSIPFRWMPYAQLWDEWTKVPALREHAANLKARYEVSI